MRKRLYRNFPLLALLGIMLLAGFLRFYGLGFQSLWNDELNTWGIALSNDSLAGTIAEFFTEMVGVHPPGYYLLIQIIAEYFGDSEWVLRLPSAIAGLLSVFATYLLGRRLYSWREGLIAALLMAVLWTPVYYSQEARMYSLLLLFTILATYFWVPILRSLDRHSRPGFFSVLGYVFSAALASYLHYFGFYLVALQGLWVFLLFIRRPRMLVYVFLVYGLVLLAYAPWMPVLFGRMGQGAGAISHIGTPGLRTFLNYAVFVFSRSPVFGLVVLVLYLFLLVKRLYPLYQTGGRAGTEGLLRSPGFLLGLWLTVPFAGAYVVSLLWTPILEPRYLIISLPPAYLLVARAVTRLPLRPSTQGVAVVAGAALLLFQLTFLMNYYSEPSKEQIREAVQFAVENERPDSLLAYCAGVRTQFFDYYLVRSGSDREFQVRACETEDELARLIEEGNYRYVSFVASRPPEEPVLNYLRNELELVEEKNLIKADSYLLEVR